MNKITISNSKNLKQKKNTHINVVVIEVHTSGVRLFLLVQLCTRNCMHSNVFSIRMNSGKQKNVSTNAGRMAKVWDG